MSRRKQSRPRSVKVISEEDEFPENTDTTFEDDNNNSYKDDKNTNNDSEIISNSNISIIDGETNTTETSDSSHSDNVSAQTLANLNKSSLQAPGESKVSDEPNPEAGGKSKHGPCDVQQGWAPQLLPGVSGQQVRSSAPHHRPTHSLIPPNFLLSPSSPSSSVATPSFPTKFLPPPPHLIANPFTPPHPPLPLHPPRSSSSLPTKLSLDEMARRKKSPKSIAAWRMRYPDSSLHEDSNSNSSSTSSSSSKLARCQICPVIALDDSSPPSLPVEGHEYFIDQDGTLTIKNGVCPRNLALMLFSHVFSNQGRYEALLGENLVKFLLNLKQIVEKHQFMCPTESPLLWAKAQNVLKLYAHGSSLKVFPSAQPANIFGSFPNSNSRKRLYQDDLLKPSNTDQRFSDLNVEDNNEAGRSKLKASRTKDMRDRSEDRAHVPDNFLVEPMPTPSPSPSHSPPPVYKTFQSACKDKKSPDSGITLTPSGSERDPRDGASDSGSVGGASSRVTSPAPSISSVASSLSLAEAAKQMANTKRGSKILPIASGDGGSRYLCPICALELPNDHDLTVHIRSHNSQNARGQVAAPNTCTICGKTLSSQSSLDRHMLVHSGERPFRCKICDMSFTTNGNMHRHARIHEKNGSSTPKLPGRKPSAASSSSAQPPASSSSSSSSAKASRGKKESSQSQAEGFNREMTPSASSSRLPRGMAEFGSDKLNLFKSQQDPSAILQYYNDMSLRMGRMMFPFGSHHPAFPYPHMMPESSRLPYLSPILNPFTGEVLAKHPRLSSPAMMAAAANIAPLTHLAREMAREPSPDLRAPQSIPCQLCPKTFTSQWSLDAHTESHVIVDEQMEEENDCAKCKICKTVAKSEESLLLHTLTHHPNDKDLSEADLKRKSPSPKSDQNNIVSPPSSPLNKPVTTSPTGSGKGSNSSSNSTSSSNHIKPDNLSSSDNPGFQNLNFANFTSKKFPLIAKAFCEEECDGAARGLKLPVYPCSQCELEFPVEGARDLHEVSHLPEEYTVCPTCKCHFSSSSQLQLHMLKHVSDLHFEESRDSANQESNALSQANFLAQFGLVTKDIVMLPSMLEGLSDLNEENISSEPKDLETSNLEGKPVTVQQIKQEMEDVNKEEKTKIPKDEETDDFGAEKELENKGGLSKSQFFSLNHNHTESEKNSTSSSSLKISPSLFGEKPALKVSCSRSPSPLSVSGSDPGLEDLSLPSAFPRKHCDALLSSPQALKHQQRTHHGAAQFRCQVCSYTSTDKSTLLRHMRTHSGERPYKCAVCDYSFTTKANCERHLRQKHGFERNQMAGKIKCNQYIISSSSLSASTSVEDENGKPELPPSKSSLSPSSSDNHNRMGYQCVKCKVAFSSRKALISHMSNHHPSVPAQDYNRFTASLHKPLEGTVEETKHGETMVTPPPAHSQTKEKTSSIASFSTDQYKTHQNQLLQNLPANLLALLPKGLFEAATFGSKKDNTGEPEFTAGIQCTNDDQPLDFSSTGRSKQEVESPGFVSVSGQKFQKNKNHSSEDSGEDEVILTAEEDGPIDLSVASVPKLQPQQTEVKAVNLSHAQTIFPNQNDRPQAITNFGEKVGNKYSPGTLPVISNSDSTDHELLACSTSSRAVPQSAAFNLSSQKTRKVDTNQAQSKMVSPKHPAFPQFISMMTSPTGQTMLLQGVTLGATQITGLNTPKQDQNIGSRDTTLTLNEKMAAFLPDNMTLRPSVFPAGIPLTVLQEVAKSGPGEETPKTKSNIKAEAPVTTKASHRESRQGKNISLAQQRTDGKGKGSSSESDSSCDLASVNKILDATDAQRFQSFLNVAREDDELEYRSESIESGEDSNASLENMYSKSLTSSGSLKNNPRPKSIQLSPSTEQGEAPSSQQDVKTSEPQNKPQEDMEAVDKRKVLPSVTVNVALVDPIVFDKDIYAGDKLDLSCKKRSKPEVSDPNNMSEQAIAALIEKVSRENVCSPAKKKRNSYADSPHKFSCPYCSRCFPWLSSLNRHLLTHTGQKPFKCPRCPVTFSTKSNRERHLIRKHNVNMADAASRASLDRPYKCHLCAFSAFSTSNNLARHYRDRHPELSPPHIADEALGSDGETEDISYDDEEEYNSLAEVSHSSAYGKPRGQAAMRGLSDKDIMLQNYTQDDDDDHINSRHNNNSIKTDTHKKRNAVFSLDNPENGMKVAHPTVEKLTNLINRGDNSSHINGVANGRNNLALFSTNKYGASTRPGIDDTVLTDTMKNFLDKSVRQALEDSQRRAMEEGSKFVITPAIERHLRSLPSQVDPASGLSTNSSGEDAREEVAQCILCDKDFPTHESLTAHINQDHDVELPYRCHLCDMAFYSRLECLQHLENAHPVQWADICVRNNIGNIQVFATRLDKMIKKINKRQNGSGLAINGNLNTEKDAAPEMIQRIERKGRSEEEEEQHNAESNNHQKLERDEENTQNGNHEEENSSDEGSDQSFSERNGDGIGADAGAAPEVVNDDRLQRKFYCSVCPKRYSSLSDLHTHMRSHTGERPHECLVCGRRFHVKNSLTRHMYRHHADQIKEAKATVKEELPRDKIIQTKNQADSDGCVPDASSSVKCEEDKKDPDRKSTTVKEPCKEESATENTKGTSESTEAEDDMLHDLLGVESSTIDQIFDAQDSAASLLGV